MFSRSRAPAIGAVLVSLGTGATVPVCAAQEHETSVSPAAVAVETSPVKQPHAVSWTEGMVLLGGAGLLLAADPNVSHETVEHPTPAAGDAASVFRVAGDARFYAALSLGTLGAGWVSGSDGITRTGRQLVASGALAAASFGLLKIVTGRSRPDAGEGAYEFHPFSSSGSFPSGHTATAFAMATTLGDAIGSPWVSGGLYLFAAGTAWSRVYNARHWPSDVFVGAMLGVTSAKFVNGRWRVFGLHAPQFLVGPGEAGLRLQF